MTLVDPYGRRITGLRMALTPRCNLRCIYCHHEGEVSPGREISAETAVNLARAGAEEGMRAIKLTGGEPLLRSDLERIVSALPDRLDISLTTNGIFLEDRAHSLARAGLDRVNVSLDSLDPRIYQRITGGGASDLDCVIAGIEAAIDADLDPIKVNMVVLRENESEVPRLIEFTRERGLILQLIELLDLNGNGLGGDLVAIEKDLNSRAERVVTREMHRRKKYFLDGAEVEVVRPMDNTEFCAHCHRLRVTSDGKLKPCLLRSDNLVDLDGAGPAEMGQLLREATSRRAPFFCDELSCHRC